MPVVAMPDGTQVSFPDEMPADQIKGLIAQKFPNEVKATGPQGFGGHAMDFLKSIPGGLREGLGGILSATGQAAQAEMSQPIDYNPTPEQADAALEKGVTGPLPTPQGPAGGFGRTLGQFAAGAPFGPPGMGLGARAAQTVIPAIATEAAGQATAGTSAEGGARLAGTIGGSLLAGRGPGAPSAKQIGASAEIPSTQQLLKVGGQQKDAYRGMMTPYSPDISSALADHVDATLKAADSRRYIAGKTFAAIDELRTESNPANVSRVLSKLSQSADGDERFAAAIARKEIDNFIARTDPQAGEMLARANANYAAGKRAQTIDVGEEVAGLRAGRAGYGGNAPNTMRQVLSPIVERALKGQTGGLSSGEIRAMRDIVEGTTATNTMRGLGGLSPSKGGIQMGVAIGTGGVTAGIGAIGNKLATVMTANQIERLNELVRKRSPAYEEAVVKSAQRYFDSAQEMANSPSHRTLAKLVNASRGFSAGLKRDGIEVGSGDLIRQIQGPVRSGADDEQP